MAFTQSDLVKLSAKVLAAQVVSSENNKQWFEATLPSNTIVDAQSVWSEMSSLKALYSANVRESCQKAFDNPDLIKAYGYNADGTFDDTTAIRLTNVTGTNGHDWLLTDTFGDLTNTVRNIISPTQIPRPNGLPSAGYSVRLFRGLPSAGNEIITSFGFDGNEVGWFFSAANSLAMFADDTKPSSTDVIYACAFQYVGSTGGGGGVSGNSIILEDPDGRWRISTADGTHLHFERWDEVSENVFEWKTWFKVGASASSDGIILTKPYAINVDLNPDSLDDSGDPLLRSVFRLTGENNDMVFGNSQLRTVFETERGTEVVRADSVRDEQEITNRPLDDLEVILDNTDTPETGSFKTIQWVSNINYTTDASHIRFNELAFNVVESSDDVNGCPIRISVLDLDGNLIQENVSIAGLNAGINGNFNFKSGFNFYSINPKYTDVRFARTITRLDIAKGCKVKLTAGEYQFTDQNGDVQTQIVPTQKAKVEFLNYVNIVDGSNIRDEIYKSSGVIVEGGVNAYNAEFSSDVYPLISTAEHTNAYMAVAGNYEDTTFIASGEGGVKVLFNDATTRTEFFTTPSKDQFELGKTPQFWKEVTEFELDIDGIFTKEMDVLSWDIVNTERFTPLIRNENTEPVGYRVEVLSTLVDTRFQENQTKFEFLDRKFRQGYTINPTIDIVEPAYVKLRLPRSRYTINRSTPRKIKYYFSDPIKLYGFYKDPTDPLDPTTGTFVPSIKATVTRVFEQSVVSGEDLEERVDQLQGDKEYQQALEANMPTLHLWPPKLVLADKDGEWLLFGDVSSIYSDQDEFQYLFSTGAEAYFELTSSQGSFQSSNTWFKFNPVVVGVPTDAVAGFEVSFGWHSSFDSATTLKYGQFTFFIDSNGGGFDSKVVLNIPVNASVNWRFRRRRDGSFSVAATPYNDNLASTWLGINNDLSGEMPVDPNSPLD